MITDSPADIAKLSDTANLGARFALAEDIVLGGSGGWMPAGNSDDPFAWTFYGNGHTVTIKGFAEDLPADIGLFGVAEDAVIRDIELVYADPPVIDSSSYQYTNIGGIAGQVKGSTEILNCIVRGESTEDALSYTSLYSGSNPHVRMGGLVGFMTNPFDKQNTSNIQNCRAALNVTLSTPNNIHLRVGGVVGYGFSTGTLANINSTAIVIINKKGGSGYNYIGGIAGEMSFTSLLNCVFSGKIDIPDMVNNSYPTYIGGLVGQYSESGTVNFCEVSGDLIIVTSSTASASLGGLFGDITGKDNENCFIIRNSNYLDGVISFNGSGSIGGFGGVIGYFTDIKNYHSAARSVTAMAASEEGGAITIGGFAGQISQTSTVDCSSTSPVSVPAGHTSKRPVYAGGFCGRMTSGMSNGINVTSKLERCFATGSVSIYSGYLGGTTLDITSSDTGSWAGGLVGSVYTLSGSSVSTISQCYATGNVSAVNHSNPIPTVIEPTPRLLLFAAGGLVGLAARVEIRESYATGNVSARRGSGGNVSVMTGGLVGFLGYYTGTFSTVSSITDCYALGNVSADNPNSASTANIYAGGLVGYAQITADTRPVDTDPDLYSANAGYIQRSFAGGSVTAQNASSGAGVWTGGVTGYIVSGGLLNTAATGRNREGGRSSVSAQGGADNGTTIRRLAGRIFGEYKGAAPAAPSFNYANAAIFTGTDSSYYAYPPNFTTVVTNGNSEPAAATSHGADTTNALFSGSAFWTGTQLLFNSEDNGGNTSAWDFGSVSQGWPVLANVGGEQ